MRIVSFLAILGLVAALTLKMCATTPEVPPKAGQGAPKPKPATAHPDEPSTSSRSLSPQPVVSPAEPPLTPDDHAKPRGFRPVYREEAPAYMQPQPVLEPPEPTRTQPVPQSMIDEQNREGEHPPFPASQLDQP